MEFQRVVDARRMVRRYDTDRAVDAEVLDRVLRNATHAPSAGFSQGWEFVVLDRPADTAAFWAATVSGDDDEPDRWLTGMQTAPVIVLPLADKAAYLDRYAEPDKGWTDRDERRWPVPYWLIDTGMASLLILLTCTDAGLGACFFGIPPDRVATLRESFGIPDGLEPIGAITIGHPAPDVASGSLRRGRRTEVIHRGRWRGETR